MRMFSVGDSHVNGAIGSIDWPKVQNRKHRLAAANRWFNSDFTSGANSSMDSIHHHPRPLPVPSRWAEAAPGIEPLARQGRVGWARSPSDVGLLSRLRSAGTLAESRVWR